MNNNNLSYDRNSSTNSSSHPRLYRRRFNPDNARRRGPIRRRIGLRNGSETRGADASTGVEVREETRRSQVTAGDTVIEAGRTAPRR